jgi:signal transduction histidine kinase
MSAEGRQVQVQWSWGGLPTSLEHWIAAHSHQRIGLTCTIAVLLIGYIDYITGTQITLSVIYAFPISVMALFVGGWSAIGLSVFSVIVSIASDVAAGIQWSTLSVPVANGLLRLLFYAFLVFILTRLRRLQTGLEIRVQERALALARETAERQRLEQEMLEISEREQRRIGQDLHDGLCQHLTGTALAGHVLAEKLATQKLGETQDARRIVDLVEEAISLARRMAKGLHPVELEADGLMQALEEFTATTTELFGVQCRFECSSPVLIYSPATATHLYRIAQEAVSNAIKHGHAGRITVALEETESGVRLSVSDDGEGMTKAAPAAKGMGLRIMAERAKMIGGRFSVQAHRPRGVELSCLIPQVAVSGQMEA